mmetsp:Transcript_23328/g.66293  ORF Transcript_23328/g.66293 Transcript_23328/m.66293 type:complete len:225 (+) Transcript_23328:768-1442(+)
MTRAGRRSCTRVATTKPRLACCSSRAGPTSTSRTRRAGPRSCSQRATTSRSSCTCSSTTGRTWTTPTRKASLRSCSRASNRRRSTTPKRVCGAAPPCLSRPAPAWPSRTRRASRRSWSRSRRAATTLLTCSRSSRALFLLSLWSPLALARTVAVGMLGRVLEGGKSEGGRLRVAGFPPVLRPYLPPFVSLCCPIFRSSTTSSFCARCWSVRQSSCLSVFLRCRG